MMRKNVLRKDLFMEIRKSIGRFLSIFLIVALGVSILTGIRGTKPDMIRSGDAYADENRLMDLKVVSTYGFTQDDLRVIEKLPAIEKVEGAFSMDVLCTVGEDEKVLHVMSGTKELNRLTVEKGRLPEKSGECLADQDFLETTSYKIGDKIELRGGDGASLEGSLKHTSYTIVGSGSTPLYFASDRGSSSIGNGTVSAFLVVQPEEFLSGIYTEVYAAAADAREETAFTPAYDDLVEEAMKEISYIQNARCEIRRDGLLEEARSELDARGEQAQAEISKNEAQLKDAEWELKLAQAQAESGRAQAESAKAQLDLEKDLLADVKEAYQEAESGLDERRKNLKEQIGQTGSGELEEALEALNRQIDGIAARFESQIAEGEKKVAEADALLRKKQEELAQAEKRLAAGERELAAKREALEAAKVQAQTQIQEGEEQLSGADLPVWYVSDRSAIPDYEGFGENADRVDALSLVFPSIFFLVAALISLTAMTRMIDEQRLQIGTLKALGYKKSTILKKYVSYALLATAGGGTAGFLIGGKLFPYIIVRTYKLIFYRHIPQMVLRYPWADGLAALALAMLCTGGAALVSCYQSLSAQPAALIRPKAPAAGKRTLLEHCPVLWKRLSFTWKATFRNLFRYKKRFFMTLFGIGGCMGLVMVGFGLRDSISDIARLQYQDLQLYDSSVYLGDHAADGSREKIAEYLDKNAQVKRYLGVDFGSVTAGNGKREEDAYLMVIGDTKAAEKFVVFQNRITKKKYALSDKGIILTEKTAALLDVKAGDTIEIRRDDEAKARVRIADICENYVGHYVYMTDGLYRELYGKEPACSDFLIQMKDGAGKRQTQQVGEELLKMDGVLSVQYTSSLSERLADMLYALDRVILVLVVVAGLLSFAVLYNLNSINITERRRELATLKVLGFHDMEVTAYVCRENVLLTLLGVAVGCGFGKFLHAFTIRTVEIDTVMFGRQISGVSYLVSMLLTVGFSVIVNGIMFFSLKKIDMVESLKSVE